MKQLYDYLVSLTMFVLILAGLAGIVFHAFRNDGWVASGLGGMWSFETGHPLVAVPLTLVAALALRAGYQHQLGNGRTGALPTFLVYALMASGAYYIGMFAWQRGI